MSTRTVPAGSGRPRARDLPAGTRIALARVALEVRLFLREPQQVVFSLLYPVIMMVIFGSVFHGQDIATGGVSYSRYFLAGIAATGIMLTSFQAVAIDIAVERDDGTLARLQATVMPTWAYFVGKLGQVLVTTVGQLILLLAVARWLFSVPVPVDAGHWVTFAWVGLLGAAAGTAVGVAAAALPRSGRSANVVIAPIALVLQFFSGVFFDYAQLPPWMQDAAAVFPLKWMTQGMRSALLPDSAARLEVGGGWEHGETALVLGVWVIVGVVLGVRTFRWRRS